MIYALNLYDIVEGKEDKKALKQLGITKVIQLNKRPIYKVVEELIEKKNSISIHKVYQLLYTDVFEKEAIQKAINDPFIAESCRKGLVKRWGNEIENSY